MSTVYHLATDRFNSAGQPLATESKYPFVDRASFSSTSGDVISVLAVEDLRLAVPTGGTYLARIVRTSSSVRRMEFATAEGATWATVDVQYPPDAATLVDYGGGDPLYALPVILFDARMVIGIAIVRPYALNLGAVDLEFESGDMQVVPSATTPAGGASLRSINGLYGDVAIVGHRGVSITRQGAVLDSNGYPVGGDVNTLRANIVGDPYAPGSCEDSAVPRVTRPIVALDVFLGDSPDPVEIRPLNNRIDFVLGTPAPMLTVSSSDSSLTIGTR